MPDEKKEKATVDECSGFQPPRIAESAFFGPGESGLKGERER